MLLFGLKRAHTDISYIFAGRKLSSQASVFRDVYFLPFVCNANTVLMTLVYMDQIWSETMASLYFLKSFTNGFIKNDCCPLKIYGHFYFNFYFYVTLGGFSFKTIYCKINITSPTDTI